MQISGQLCRGEVRVRARATTLGDIGRNGARAATKLTRQTLPLFDRELRGNPIDLECQGVRLVPNLQLAEVLHRFPSEADG